MDPGPYLASPLAFINKLLFLKAKGEAWLGPGYRVILGYIISQILLIQVLYKYLCSWKHLTDNLEKGIVHLRLTCLSRRQKQAQKWHLDSSACQRWGWLQWRICWGSSSPRRLQKVYPESCIPPCLDRTAGQYLQGPQSVGEKSVSTYRYVKWG